MRGNGRRGVTRRCAGDPEREERASKSESAPDPVKRDFSADGPNKARFAGIAHVRTHRGWLCPAAAMGARSRRVAGRPMAPGMTAEPAGDALETAMARRGPEGAARIARTAGAGARRRSSARPWGRAESRRPRGRSRARGTAPSRSP